MKEIFSLINKTYKLVLLINLMTNLTIEGESEIENGLRLVGFDSEGGPIRYEQATNRVFIRYGKDFDYEYYSIGKLIYLIDSHGFLVIPIVYRNFSFTGPYNFKSRFFH